MATLEGLQKRDDIEEILIFDSGNPGTNKIDMLGDKRQIRLSKYELNEQNQNLIINERNFPSNLLVGGWSNLWGATILPWCESALKNLFGTTELNKYYDLIGDFLEYQAESDNLEPEYKLFGKTHKRETISEIGETLIKRSDNNQNKDFVIGKSRLAINALSEDFNQGCIECGECLTGCPYGHIMNSRTYFQKKTEIKIRILYNCFVVRLIDENYIKIEYKDSKNNILIHDQINLIFIATGTMKTAELISRSFNITDIYTKETPMVLIPGFYFGLKKWGQSKVQGISLSEMFIQSKQNKEGVDSAGQIYSLNKQIIKIILPKIFQYIVPRVLLNKFIVIMFFVKSRKYGYIKVTGEDIDINLKKYSKNIFKPEIKKLKKYFISMKFILVFSKFFIQRSGHSYHYGGLYVKRNENYEEIVDCNGKIMLTESPRIKVVDGSTLKNPEPGPVTYTIMANSLRITKSIDFDSLK